LRKNGEERWPVRYKGVGAKIYGVDPPLTHVPPPAGVGAIDLGVDPLDTPATSPSTSARHAPFMLAPSHITSAPIIMVPSPRSIFEMKLCSAPN
jgi:hypothetical protein